MPKVALKVAGVVFLLVALLHLARLLFKFDVTVAGYSIPLWVNGLGFVIALALAVWLFNALKKLTILALFLLQDFRF